MSEYHPTRHLRGKEKKRTDMQTNKSSIYTNRHADKQNPDQTIHPATVDKLQCGYVKNTFLSPRDLSRVYTWRNRCHSLNHYGRNIINSQYPVAEWYKRLVGRATPLLITTCNVISTVHSSTVTLLKKDIIMFPNTCSIQPLSTIKIRRFIDKHKEFSK